MSSKHRRHHKSKAFARQEMERRMHDTDHEQNFPLVQGPPESDDIIPVPDRTRWVPKLEDMSYSDSEGSGASDESESGSRSGSEDGDGESSDSYSSSDEDNEPREAFVEVSSKNDQDMITQKLRDQAVGMMKMTTSVYSKNPDMGENYEGLDVDNDYDDNDNHAPEAQQQVPSSHYKKHGRYSEYGGEEEKHGRHKGRKGRMYEEKSEGRKQSGSYAGKYHRGGRSDLPPGVRRGREGKFQATSSSGKEVRSQRIPQETRRESFEEYNNTDSSCHMHSERSKKSKRKRDDQPPSSSGKNLGNGTRQQAPNSRGRTGPESTGKPVPSNTPSSNGKDQSSSNIFSKNDAAFDSTIYKIQFRGTPGQLDKMANHDHENRLQLDLGNECVSLASTTSEEMNRRIHANIMKQKSGNPFSTQSSLGSVDSGSETDLSQSFGKLQVGKGVGGNTTSAGGKSSSSNVDLTRERDLVKRVVLLSGNNPFPHDVEFKLPNIIVPGHHGPGQTNSDKGLSIILGAHENVVQPREIATGKITNDATKYPEIYPQFTRLEDLTNHTFEDKSLNAQKIKHSSERPHPVVHYFQGAVSKRERMSPGDVDSILAPSKDNGEYMVMNKEWFDKTVDEMKKSPSVTSKLNNLSDVSNMQVFVVPSESKGDISRVLRQRETSTSNSSSASGKHTTTKGVPSNETGTTTNEKNTTSASLKKQRFPSLRKPSSPEQQSTSAQGKSASGRFTTVNEETTSGLGNEDGHVNTDGDFSARSWIRSSECCGHDTNLPKQAFLTLQVQSLPVSGLKKTF